MKFKVHVRSVITSLVYFKLVNKKYSWTQRQVPLLINEKPAAETYKVETADTKGFFCMSLYYLYIAIE